VLEAGGMGKALGAQVPSVRSPPLPAAGSPRAPATQDAMQIHYHEHRVRCALLTVRVIFVSSRKCRVLALGPPSSRHHLMYNESLELTAHRSTTHRRKVGDDSDFLKPLCYPPQ
jgi:hypothetical protein